MVKIKRVVMAFVFLLSQVSLAKTTVGQSKSEVFDNLPLSAMILSEAELSNLKNEDRIVYLRALMYLGQVLEISQSNNFDYEIPKKYEGKKTGLNESSAAGKNLFSIYWNLIVSESHALIGWVMKGLEVGGARISTSAASTALRTAELAKSGVGGVSGVVMRDYASKIAVAEKAGDVARIAKLEKEVVARGLDPAKVRALSKLPDVKTLKATVETKLKDVKVLEQQREAARAAGNLKDVKKLDTEIRKAAVDIEKTKSAFLAAGGQRSQLAAIYRSSNTSTGRVLVNNIAEGVLLTGGVYYGGKAMGIWGDTQVKLDGGDKGKKVRDTISSPDANKDPGKIIKEQGYSCIYGGRPSTFVKTENGVLCKMPEEGQSKTCSVNEGKYLCPTYGFRKVGSTEETELCVDLEPRRELTSNCVEKFETFVIESGEVAAKGQDEKVILEYNEKIRQLLTTLEGDYMSDIESKRHSFGYYCANSKKAQKSECNAITAFINTLKDRPEIKKAIQERAVASADAASAPAVPPVEVKAAK